MHKSILLYLIFVRSFLTSVQVSGEVNSDTIKINNTKTPTESPYTDFNNDNLYGRESYIDKYGDSLIGPNNILSWYILINENIPIISKDFALNSIDYYPFNYKPGDNNKLNLVNPGGNGMFALRGELENTELGIKYSFWDTNWNDELMTSNPHKSLFSIKIPLCYCLYEKEIKQMLPISLFDINNSENYQEFIDKLERRSYVLADTISNLNQKIRAKINFSFEQYPLSDFKDKVKFEGQYFYFKIDDRYYYGSANEGVDKHQFEQEILIRLKYYQKDFRVRYYPTLKNCKNYAYQIIDLKKNVIINFYSSIGDDNN